MYQVMNAPAKKGVSWRTRRDGEGRGGRTELARSLLDDLPLSTLGEPRDVVKVGRPANLSTFVQIELDLAPEDVPRRLWLAPDRPLLPRSRSTREHIALNHDANAGVKDGPFIERLGVVGGEDAGPLVEGPVAERAGEEVVERGDGTVGEGGGRGEESGGEEDEFHW